MRIAFVGVKRKMKELPENYLGNFIKFHLEIPYYFAFEGRNHVDVITTDDVSGQIFFRLVGGSVFCRTEEEFKKSDYKYDVVFHWRSYFEDLRKDCVNVMLSQDHSYDQKWLSDVRKALDTKKLDGILVFKTWHGRNMTRELGGYNDKLFEDTTFGVDTEIYKPAPDKDPYQMLWASDPGRGLAHAVNLAIVLNSFDKRFKLHVCHPDYVKNVSPLSHPAIVWHGNIGAGEELQKLFNMTGILPYTSTFPEPSSRVHRQAQAAGSLVLYPPGMGTPSETIVDHQTGIVAPIHEWPRTILRLVQTGEWKKIGENARKFAEGETWKIQSDKFNKLIERIKGNK